MRPGRDYRDFFDLAGADETRARQTQQDFVSACAADLTRLGAAPDRAVPIADALYKQMSCPKRHYHTPVHVLAMFRHAENAGVKLTDAERLAVWFHDSIFDIAAPPGVNEDASADHLLTTLAAASSYSTAPSGIDARVLHDAATIVRATADHLKASVAPLAETVMDLDLAGLASEPGVFARQSEAVRAEASHLSDSEYRAATVRFFTALLARRRLFRTAPFARLEADARRQIAAEIERLSAAV
jgi:predicted metal-dependent HD superfamily phosphohydrolase